MTDTKYLTRTRHYSRFIHGYNLGETSPNDYQDMVTGPGKFEGHSSYIPYVWDHADIDYDDSEFLYDMFGIDYEGWDENDDIYGYMVPSLYSYDVCPADLLLFPELSYVRTIYLYEDDQGFVNVYRIDTSDKPIEYPFMGI